MRREILITAFALLLGGCAVSIDHVDVFAVRDAQLPIGALVLPDSVVRESIKEISVEASGRRFFGYKISAPKPTRAVLFFNGNGYGAASSIGRMGAAFADEATDVYVVSYAVPPESPPYVAQVYALAERLAQEAIQSGIPSERVAVVGHSLGGWVAMHLATTPLVGCAVVAGAGTTAEQTATHLLPGIVSAVISLQPTKDVLLLDNIQQARASRVPVLIVASESDETMPTGEARKIFAVLPEQNRQLQIFPGVTHGAYFRNLVVVDRIREFIRGSCGVAPGAE